MTQLIVTVDIDGVTADTYTELFNLYNNHYDDNLAYKVAMVGYEHTTWKIKSECGDKILDYFNSPTLYDNVEPMEGALEGVEYLRNLGYRVVFNSTCFINRSDDKLKWLIKHKFLKPSKNIYKDWIVVADKSLINANIMIDDRPENIYKFKGLGIIFDQPYNQQTLADARLRGWADIERTMSHLYPDLYENVYAE